MKLPKILALAVFATLSVAAPAYAAVQGSAAFVVESADGNKTKVKAVVQDVAWGGEDGTPQPKAGTANITLKRGMIDAATLAHLQDDKVLIPSLTLHLAGEAGARGVPQVQARPLLREELVDQRRRRRHRAQLRHPEDRR